MAMMVKVDDKNLITAMDDICHVIFLQFRNVTEQNIQLASVGTLYRERWWFTIMTLNYKIIKEPR